MKRTAFIIMLITILSKLIGFSRDIALSYFFGATGVSDAYLISLTIPGVIAGFIGIGISTGYIPILTSVEKKRGLETGEKFTNNLINFSIVVYTVIFFIGFIFTESLVKLFASGFDENTFLLAVKFSRITISGIYFTGIVHIYRGYLQVRGSYFAPELALIPMNIIVILSIVLAFNYNVTYLAYGRVIAIASQIIVMIPWLIKYGYKYKPYLSINDEYIKRISYIGLPIILGVSVNEINILVDRTLASQIAVGGITALNYASRLSGFIQGIFVVSISTALYPTISKCAAEKDYKKLKSFANGAFFGVSTLILPASIGSLIFSKEIINLLFGRGAFDESALILTSSALFFYSVGMLGVGWREILSRIFYSMQDTRTPMTNAATGMVLNIVLNIILSKHLGIGGLALATSVSALFTAGLLLINLRKKIGPFGMKQISISFLKILFASSIMGLLAKLSFNYLTATLSQNLSLLLAIGVGSVSYFVIIYFMKIEDVDVIVGAVKKKIGRGAA